MKIMIVGPSFNLRYGNSSPKIIVDEQVLTEDSSIAKNYGHKSYNTLEIKRK